MVTVVERHGWFERMGGALCGAWYVGDKQVGLAAAVGGSASGRVAHLCGLLVRSIGFFLFVGAFPLLVWNEREAIGITRSLEEGQGLVQIAPPDSLDRSLNSKLVHFSGSFQDLPTLTDPEFGVKVKAIALSRETDMYQFQERSHSRETKDSFGAVTRTTTYTYEPTWSSSVINSRSFKESGRSNPSSIPYESKSWKASRVRLGPYSLSGALQDSITWSEELDLSDPAIRSIGPPSDDHKRSLGGVDGEDDEDEDEGSFDDDDDDGRSRRSKDSKNKRSKKDKKDSKRRDRDRRAQEDNNRRNGEVAARGFRNGQALIPAPKDMVVSGNALYSGTPSDPVIGDVRVKFRAVAPKTATVIAKQEGENLVPFRTSGGYTISLIQPGHLTVDEMFDRAHSENTIRTWFIRLGGFLAMFVGLLLLLNPASVAVQWIPFLGGFASSLIGCGTCLVATTVSSSFTLATIALAWIAVRPLYAGAILLFAAFVLFGSYAQRDHIPHSTGPAGGAHAGDRHTHAGSNSSSASAGPGTDGLRQRNNGAGVDEHENYRNMAH